MSKSTVRSHAAGYELEPQALRHAVLTQLPRRMHAMGALRLPAVPALLEHYTAMLGKLFALHGRAYSPEELAHLSELLSIKLNDGFAAARNAFVQVQYQTDEPPKVTLSYTFTLELSTPAEEYAGWVEARKPELFGSEPDAKVMELAQSLWTPNNVKVLDVGAGAGRNALGLARAGFEVSAVERSPDLARVLREQSEREKLAVRLYEGDVLDTSLELPRNHYDLLVLAALVSDLRDAAELDRLFQRAGELVAPRGTLLVSAFVPVGGYQPDELARQLSFVLWSTIFPRDELRTAATAAGFALSSEEPVFEYEKEHLAEGAWPPTAWFEEWTRGVDTFDVPMSRAPVEMRWFTFKKSG